MLTTSHPARRSAGDTFRWQLRFSLRDWRAKGFAVQVLASFETHIQAYDENGSCADFAG